MRHINYKKEFNDCFDTLKIHDDFFLFDSDDIELSFLKRIIEKSMKKYKLSQYHKELAEAYFHEIMLIFEKTEFDYLSFPFLKHSLTPTLASLKDKLDNNAQRGYFLILFFSHLTRIRSKLFMFYYENIKKNNFGLPKILEGKINAKLLESAIYLNFVGKLTQWYVKNEFILFFLQFLNDFYDIQLLFNENEFSIEKNYDFNLKIFMKKSFYKLSGFLLKKLSVLSKSFFYNRAVTSMGSKHLLFFVLSSFTYGISLKKFTKVDLKPFALLVFDI